MNIETFYRKSFKRQIKQIRNSLKYNKHLAEDIVQEAYLKSIKYYPSFDENKSSINTWFNKILFNVLREYQKDHPFLLELSEDKLIDTSFLRLDFLVIDEIDKVENDKHKEILYLYFILGYNSLQISNILEDISQTNVTTISSRFQEKIREKYGNSI